MALLEIVAGDQHSPSTSTHVHSPPAITIVHTPHATRLVDRLLGWWAILGSQVGGVSGDCGQGPMPLPPFPLLHPRSHSPCHQVNNSIFIFSWCELKRTVNRHTGTVCSSRASCLFFLWSLIRHRHVCIVDRLRIWTEHAYRLTWNVGYVKLGHRLSLFEHKHVDKGWIFFSSLTVPVCTGGGGEGFGGGL